ncbi:hypothetical protein BAE44_0009279 [Dichanthelium oligosanthes]|uniref:Leucine-rich repeat-containing N-terminal plant-type domain-containing protein n=1 Tax=Dichanthelium oligosanthes TaxID=888268 RepID=A0A1E5VX76_9POAL|nr:hypothetical protein BAE44_0009279 [Dichanthelium oligosanthes]
MGSYLSWRSLSLILCVLPAIFVLSSYGCFIEERAALMDIRSSLLSAHSMFVPDSWGRGDDCCSWERVFLDLSWNYPSFISLEGSVALTKLRYLDLRINGLGRSILSFVKKFDSLEVLILNRNSINGALPPAAFENLTNLRELNLSRNNLIGSLPAGISIFPSSSQDSRSLRQFVHRKYNHFMGNLDWVRYLDNIRLLSLGANMFEGRITPDLYKLQYLRIIDFSHNKLRGSLPACMGNISFKGDADGQIFNSPYQIISDNYNASYDLKGFTFATKWHLYAYSHNFFTLMSGIDVSANMLDGEIPWELGNLSHIKSLNLSYNLFDGPKPATFADMNEMESLDLSHNNLNGSIPWQLTQLWSLEAFSVAYNNLSGCIPNSGQLSSFSMESYQGNIDLHKSSWGNKCLPSSGPVEEEDMREAYDDPFLYAISAASFVLALWATVAFLLPFIRAACNALSQLKMTSTYV